ncbi:MAG: hypothetical protein JNN20_13675 [Betaproteobacteria bacterium]|nr:hypothetical protein [Betaproteobacteria bacterium]
MPLACPNTASKYLAIPVHSRFCNSYSIRSNKLLALLCALYVSGTLAQTPAIKEVDVRSFLGDPLNVRIAVDASLERDTPNCHSVIDRGEREGMLQSRDLQLTMVELRAARYLLVRSRTAINEPVVSFALRIGCPGEPVVEREFTLLLDPPPFTATVATPAVAGIAKTPSSVPAAGIWTVVAGDTLQSIARGIHPKNRLRQRQYLQAMRGLNPDLAKFADSAPLVAGTQLRTPDLKTLSGILPTTTVAKAAADAAPQTKPQDSTKPAVTAPPTPTSTAPKPPKRASAAPPAAAPAPAARTPEKRVAESVAPSAPSTKAVEPASGFRLRLSNAEIDLSRSRNVTDEQRNLLREKQLMLDSDDQVAALLSLRNTVKQLETRLNEMQLKMATAAPSVAAPVVAEEKAEVSPPALQAAPQAAPPTTSDKAGEKPAAASPVSEPATSQPAAAKATPAAAAVKIEPAPVTDDLLPDFLPAWLLAAVVGSMVLLFAAWRWAKRGKAARSHDDRHDAGNPLLSAPVTQMGPSKSEAEFSDWAEGDDKARSVAAGANTAAPIAAPAVPPQDIRLAPTARKAVVAEDHEATVRIDTPVIFEDTPARYELDSTPVTTVDFPLGLDDKPPEDRVRRLQYMHERFPELKTNTVSIDDADSVINASRLYYDEGDNRGGGLDKACELLTFAVEERPQEIRFWLAQFEIFRLENMIAEFGALAAKFQMLFSHTPAWPKVRHIGHEIDPGNPLYAESGRPSLGGESRFDPIAENWLNAPMDFTSDALMSDLRQALLDDHNITRADFDAAAAKLTAGAA